MVSLPPVVMDAAEDLIRKGGFSGLSDYLQAQIRIQSGLDSFMRPAALSAP